MRSCSEKFRNISRESRLEKLLSLATDTYIKNESSLFKDSFQ